MKTSAQQNRVIIPILVIALIGLMARIVTMLRGDDATSPVVTPAQSVVGSPSTVHSLAMPRETTARDPFFHPALMKVEQAAAKPGSDPRLPHGIAADQPSSQQQAGAGPLNASLPAPIDVMGMVGPRTSPTIQQNTKIIPGAPQATRNSTALPVGTGTQTGAPGERPQGDHADLPSRSAESELVARLKLTAILAGDTPAVVIEGYGTHPLIAHQGETFSTLRVAAIHVAEIVLSSPHGIWTLPLDTTTAGSTTGSGALKEDNAIATH